MRYCNNATMAAKWKRNPMTNLKIAFINNKSWIQGKCLLPHQQDEVEGSIAPSVVPRRKASVRSQGCIFGCFQRFHLFLSIKVDYVSRKNGEWGKRKLPLSQANKFVLEALPIHSDPNFLKTQIAVKAGCHCGSEACQMPETGLAFRVEVSWVMMIQGCSMACSRTHTWQDVAGTQSS